MFSNLISNLVRSPCRTKVCPSLTRESCDAVEVMICPPARHDEWKNNWPLATLNTLLFLLSLAGRNQLAYACRVLAKNCQFMILATVPGQTIKSSGRRNGEQMKRRQAIASSGPEPLDWSCRRLGSGAARVPSGLPDWSTKDQQVAGTKRTHFSDGGLGLSRPLIDGRRLKWPTFFPFQ